MKYICNSTKYTYNRGYIALPITVKNIPASIVVSGTTLLLKSSFHVSLVCIKDITDAISVVGLEEQILKSFCTFISKKEISFTCHTNKFCFIQSDDRKSVVVMCEVSYLGEFFQVLSKELGVVIPPQPTHITLYTFQKDEGIGISSEEQMNIKSTPIETPIEFTQELRVSS